MLRHHPRPPPQLVTQRPAPGVGARHEQLGADRADYRARQLEDRARLRWSPQGGHVRGEPRNMEQSLTVLVLKLIRLYFPATALSSLDFQEEVEKEEQGKHIKFCI